jgi:hypothetical protein
MKLSVKTGYNDVTLFIKFIYHILIVTEYVVWKYIQYYV